MNSFLLNKRKEIILSSSLIISYIIYLAGFKSILVIILIVYYALLLPQTKALDSFFSRLIVSTMMFFGFFQISGIIQFFLFRGSGFNVSALILTLISLITVNLLSSNIKKPIKFISKTDFCAVLASLCFILPLVVTILNGDSLTNIVKLGSIQGNDGATHYNLITEAGKKQSITYKDGASYYPYGFHLTFAFVQDAMHIQQAKLTWSDSAKLYLFQYITLAVLFSIITFYLCMYIVRIRHAKISILLELSIALALGIPLSIFYLVPFLYNGFLNYFYIASALFCALLFLVFQNKEANKNLSLIMGSILLFGASASWPVLIPVAFIVIAGIANLFTISNVKKLSNNDRITVFFCLIMQMVPLYLQVAYSNTDTSTGINMAGGLTNFNSIFILLAIVVCTMAWYSKSIIETYSRYIKFALAPIIILVCALVAFQYLFAGEARYYSIKLSMIAEVLFLVLLVAYLVDLHIQTKNDALIRLALLAALPSVIFMAILSTSANPLIGLRDAFRDYSNQTKPAYFDSDTLIFKELGAKGDIKDFNTVAIHYNKEKGKLFSHPQIFYWSDTIGFDGDLDSYDEKDCQYKIYINLATGNFNDEEQQRLVSDIKHCAIIAKNDGSRFYVVTDKDSLSYLQTLDLRDVTFMY